MSSSIFLKAFCWGYLTVLLLIPQANFIWSVFRGQVWRIFWKHIIWWWQWQRHTKRQIQILSVSFIIDSMYAMLKLQIPYRCWWPLDVSDLLQAVAKNLFLGDSVQHHSLCSCCPVCATPAFMNVTKRPEFGKIISTEFNPGRRTSTPEPIFAAYSFISSSVSAS